MLSGSLPSWFASFSGISYLCPSYDLTSFDPFYSLIHFHLQSFLQDNKFVGPIPSSYCSNWPLLEALYSCLSHCSSIKVTPICFVV